MDPSVSSAQRNLQSVKPLMEFIFIIVAFIICFFLMYAKAVEFFGLELFCGINFIFCILLGKHLIENSSPSSGLSFRYGAVLTVGVVFSFVSTILMAMTTAKLHQKMTENNRRDMPIQPSRRTELNHAKAAFVATTVLIWITAIYTYFPLAQINQLIQLTINLAENSTETQWMRAFSPLILFVIGTALISVLVSSACQSDATADTFITSAKLSYSFFVLYGASILMSIFLIIIKQGDIFKHAWVSYGGTGMKWIFYALMVIFAIKGMVDISNITGDGKCFKTTSALPLYATYFAFIVFGLVLPKIYPHLMTTYVPIIMEYIPALGLLGTSSYLVYIANKFTGISAEEIIS